MIQDQGDVLEDIMQYGIDSGKMMTTILMIIPLLESHLIPPEGIQAASVFLGPQKEDIKLSCKSYYKKTFTSSLPHSLRSSI